jgi:hypothetical protein
VSGVYKTWVGELPHVIILDKESIGDLLYYETGFEQLHPMPEIHIWMEQRNHDYGITWKVVRVDPNRANLSDWAFCFNTTEIRDMFAMRWL